MLISFFVSGTEMAFASTPVFKWESAFKDNPQSKCYKVVKQMVKHFTYTNMMCLIIDTIVNLIISELFTLMLHPVLNES
ncbi:hypothetical protein FACS1894166_12250 [Bacilli bacterium]|nr:hypothetical protein FACS1894166_12250 [Bacilli bacterium]